MELTHLDSKASILYNIHFIMITQLLDSKFEKYKKTAIKVQQK